MDLRKLLLIEHSRTQRDRIVEWVGDDLNRMKDLMQLFFNNEKLISQRAAWAIGEIASLNPAMIKPYLAQLLNNLDRPVHDAIKRNTMRIFKNIPVPKDLVGPLYELSFNYMNDPKEAVAIRVYSMYILARIADKFPDLTEELIISIRSHAELASAGFKSAAGKTVKNLTKKLSKRG